MDLAKFKSDCCGKGVHITGVEKDGTWEAICNNCGETCDLINKTTEETQPKKERKN